jgi:tetratricopeptide (TPR) repeat protein
MTPTFCLALLLTSPAAPLFTSAEEVNAAAAAACLQRAERWYAAGRYVEAAVAYHLCLEFFPPGDERRQATQRLFDIGNYWLKDTRAEMEDWDKHPDRKPWLRLPFYWDRTKPFWAEESWALWAMAQAHRGDPSGPRADKALFLIGSVHFFREAYRDADTYFSMLLVAHDSSPLATKAMELTIMARWLRTDRPAELQQRLVDTRRLIERYQREYPHLAQAPDKARFLGNRLAAIRIRQAELAYEEAEECRKAGRLVGAVRRYALTALLFPGTYHAEKALERMFELF